MISFHQIIVENQAHFAEQVEFYEQHWPYSTDAGREFSRPLEKY